jgi:RHS repeat-associated protein
VEKVASGVTTTYVYDGASTLREVQGSATLKYVGGTGVDEQLAADDGTALSHFHADGLGSVVKVTNAAGAVTLTRQYDTWGGLEIGASETGFAFTGREWDPEIRLYYYRARYYEAGDGRFVSEDPIRFGGGVNFYSYVANGPATAVDPSGLKVQKCCRPVGANPILSFVARTAGVPHCFIKTDTQAGGMGQADPNDPRAEGLCPIGTETRVNPPPPSDTATAKCEDVPCVEESCVDIILRTRPHTGPWGRHNNCNTVVDMIIKACRKNTQECRCAK